MGPTSSSWERKTGKHLEKLHSRCQFVQNAGGDSGNDLARDSGTEDATNMDKAQCPSPNTTASEKSAAGAQTQCGHCAAGRGSQDDEDIVESIFFLGSFARKIVKAEGRKWVICNHEFFLEVSE